MQVFISVFILLELLFVFNGFDQFKKLSFAHLCYMRIIKLGSRYGLVWTPCILTFPIF